MDASKRFTGATESNGSIGISRRQTPMNADSTSLAKSYFEPLIAGDRNACRQVVDQALNVGITPYDLLTQLVWPTMELLQQLYREDRISISSLNLATRLNRLITDHFGAGLNCVPVRALLDMAQPAAGAEPHATSAPGKASVTHNK